MTNTIAKMFAIAAVLFSTSSIVNAQEVSEELKKALSFRPRQSNVDYDKPTNEELPNCRIESSLDKFKMKGYVVYDPAGRILRQFFDVDRNGKIDQWSFFKNNIEVYRDLDTNADRKTDQYRWMGTAGIRWGLDSDQNGKIDSWKMISAEELSLIHI